MRYDELPLDPAFRPKGRSKYQNIPTQVGSLKFDSRLEAARYGELLLLQAAGEIQELEADKARLRFALRVPSIMAGEGPEATICHYEADFTYKTKDGRQVVEDVKSPATRTPLYRVKRKLFRACYGVDITEISREDIRR